MKKQILTIIAISCSLFFISCSKSNSDDIEPVNQTPTDDDGKQITITYEAHVKGIMASNCISCHGSNDPKAGLSLTNYNQVRNSAANSNLIARMNSASDPMPPSQKLPQQVLDVIDEWKKNGFPEK